MESEKKAARTKKQPAQVRALVQLLANCLQV